MGQELECKARIQRRPKMQGKAQLETDFILFRGPERFKITFAELTRVTADGGILRLEFAGGPLELDLGEAAAKWAGKILNPPSMLDKLGVKPGLTVRLIGEFDAFEPGFGQQIAARGAAVVTKGKCNLLFFAAEKSAELARIAKLKANLEPGGALWVIYPKGVPDIKEIQVIQAGRAAGMKDVKVARFSATHTGLKFV
ncbi:MAG TPA: hypothetical protein VK724_09060 [Bryobacteraceae bacterium]|jgi:hypothetical protein|nr:hypothetical protein [Bryobacteraceae bacterium]